MIQHIKNLYKYDRQLLGEGYDKALDYINKILPLEILEFKSGEKFGTWTVPQEWIMRDGWVKYDGKKILDYKEEPLSIMVYSKPMHVWADFEEIKKHLYSIEENRNFTPYNFSFYEKKWGICMPHEKIYERTNDCPGCNIGATIEGITDRPVYKDILKEGSYEVFIDSEFKDGIMKVGVHTIPGKSDREILLFAHLDHPWQANDNLSGVACLMELAKKIKDPKHTIKIIFCPETIGSIAYAFTQDISKVDFMIAVDCVGNDGDVLVQKSFDKYDRINYVVHLALHELAMGYRKGDFRITIGSDEYVFNDPKIGIPGLLITKHPYREYHSNQDKPDIVKEKNIKEVQDLILKTIEIYEKDYIPVRKFKGPLMRSAYGLQTPHTILNRDTDYLIYDIDGKKWLSEICLPLGITFDFAYKFLTKLKNANLISRISKKR